jgi:hypothetical protein
MKLTRQNLTDLKEMAITFFIVVAASLLICVLASKLGFMNQDNLLFWLLGTLIFANIVLVIILIIRRTIQNRKICARIAKYGVLTQNGEIKYKQNIDIDKEKIRVSLTKDQNVVKRFDLYPKEKTFAYWDENNVKCIIPLEKGLDMIAPIEQ